jgi:hypothetical protein
LGFLPQRSIEHLDLIAVSGRAHPRQLRAGIDPAGRMGKHKDLGGVTPPPLFQAAAVWSLEIPMLPLARSKPIPRVGAFPNPLKPITSSIKKYCVDRFALTRC